MVCGMILPFIHNNIEEETLAVAKATILVALCHTTNFSSPQNFLYDNCVTCIILFMQKFSTPFARKFLRSLAVIQEV